MQDYTAFLYRLNGQSIEAAAQLEAQAIDESGGKAQQAQVEEASQQHEAQGGGSAPPFGLPTSLVKRIITVDPDVQRISADGVRSIAKATELFLQLLAAQSFRQAALLKRKNLKFQDIQTVAGKDRRLTDLGLNEFLATDSVFAEVSLCTSTWLSSPMSRCCGVC